MTETSCLVAGSEEDDKTSGHVGPPTPACGKKKTFQKINAIYASKYHMQAPIP
jgi:hypothetical protein